MSPSDGTSDAKAMQAGDIISYLEMCSFEGSSLQRGMNHRLSGSVSVILMSTRYDALYEDRIEADGRVLIYEGHDRPRSKDGPDPKSVDQPMHTDAGNLTQNGRFFRAAAEHRENSSPPDRVRVYEKVRQGIWVFNGVFDLVDAWTEPSGPREVFKFRLELTDEVAPLDLVAEAPEHSRLIPSAVKKQVWKRDGGHCVQCGSGDHLHFDHIIPYSKGGASIVAENIQLLCARHNLEKRDRIQ